MKCLMTGLFAAGVLGLALAPVDGQASTRYNLQSGASCDNADGALASGLKKTKSGILNASTGTRYITCEFPISSEPGVTSFQFDYFSAGFVGPEGAKVTCALHVGDSDNAYASTSQSMTLPNGGDKYMRFGEGYGAPVSARTSFSNWMMLTCILPPKVELQGTFLGIEDAPPV